MVSKRKKLIKTCKPKMLQLFKKQTIKTLNIKFLRSFFYDL